MRNVWFCGNISCECDAPYLPSIQREQMKGQDLRVPGQELVQGIALAGEDAAATVIGLDLVQQTALRNAKLAAGRDGGAVVIEAIVGAVMKRSVATELA